MQNLVGALSCEEPVDIAWLKEQEDQKYYDTVMDTQEAVAGAEVAKRLIHQRKKFLTIMAHDT